MKTLNIFISLLFLIGCSTPESPGGHKNSKIAPTKTSGPNTTTPPQPNSSIKWTKVISSTGESLCVLSDKRELYCWGTNFQSEGIARDRNETLDALGTGDTNKYLSAPKKVPHSSLWKEVIASQSGFLCGIDDDDYIFCWGANRIFSFGSGGPFFYDDRASTPSIVVKKPYKVSNEKFTALSSYGDTVCSIKKDDASLWCFGTGLGVFSPDSPLPVKINDGPFKKPLMFAFSILALTPLGNLWNPKKGIGVEQWQHLVADSNPFTTIPSYMCGIDQTQKLLCEGDNQQEFLGVQSTLNPVTNFTEIKGQGHFLDISSKDGRTCTIKDDGTLWCWGKNTHEYFDENGNSISLSGVLGTGSKAPIITSPEQVKPIQKAKKIAIASNGAICALTTDQKIYCFGTNMIKDQRGNLKLGILGTNNQTDKIITQAQEIGREKWHDIFLFSGADTFVGCALSDIGALWCWGGKEFSPIAFKQPIGKIIPSPVLITTE